MNFNSDEFKKSKLYDDFIKKNPSAGQLKVQVFVANQSIPIAGARVVISKIIDSTNVVFSDSLTNVDGIVDGIILPAPNIEGNDLSIPNFETYDVIVTASNFKDVNEKVQLYSDIKMIKRIQLIRENN